MILNKLGSEELNKLSTLIGKKLLQIFTQGAGIMLSSPPQIFSGKQFCLYFQENKNSFYYLKLAFDESLFNLKKNKPFKLYISHEEQPLPHFETYSCSITFPNTFLVKSIKIVNNRLELEKHLNILYLHAIIIECTEGNFVIIIQDESPNSFQIIYNNHSFMEVIHQNAYEVSLIT